MVLKKFSYRRRKQSHQFYIKLKVRAVIGFFLLSFIIIQLIIEINYETNLIIKQHGIEQNQLLRIIDKWYVGKGQTINCRNELTDYVSAKNNIIKGKLTNINNTTIWSYENLNTHGFKNGAITVLSKLINLSLKSKNASFLILKDGILSCDARKGYYKGAPFLFKLTWSMNFQNNLFEILSKLSILAAAGLCILFFLDIAIRFITEKALVPVYKSINQLDRRAGTKSELQQKLKKMEGFDYLLSRIEYFLEQYDDSIKKMKSNISVKAMELAARTIKHEIKSLRPVAETALKLVDKGHSLSETQKIIILKGALNKTINIGGYLNFYTAKLTEISENKLTITKEKMSLVEVLLFVYSSLSSVKLSQKKISVKYAIPFDYTILGDSRINFAIWNIFDNALNAIKTTKKANIHISLCSDHERQELKLSIGNTNSYILPENQPYIFNLYHTKNTQGGTGIGLYIVKEIIEEHGWRIDCLSRKDPSFTEFNIYIPFSDNIQRYPIDDKTLPDFLAG